MICWSTESHPTFVDLLVNGIKYSGAPSWVATQDSLADVARKLTNLRPGPEDIVVMDIWSNSSYMGTDEFGLPCRAAKSTNDSRYHIVGSTIFVDHASDLSYVYHQTSMTSEETLKSKLAFEKYALSHGVHIKHYHADNGRFKDTLFTRDIEEKA